MNGKSGGLVWATTAPYHRCLFDEVMKKMMMEESCYAKGKFFWNK